jgi:hypothetical protein
MRSYVKVAAAGVKPPAWNASGRQASGRNLSDGYITLQELRGLLASQRL